MPGLPAIGIDGPKGVGKTETGLQRATTVLSLDDGAPASSFLMTGSATRPMGSMST